MPPAMEVGFVSRRVSEEIVPRTKKWFEVNRRGSRMLTEVNCHRSVPKM